MEKIVEGCLNDIRIKIAKAVTDYEDSLKSYTSCVIKQCSMCGEYVTKVRMAGVYNGSCDVAMTMYKELERRDVAIQDIHECDSGTRGKLELLGVVSLDTGKVEEE